MIIKHITSSSSDKFEAEIQELVDKFINNPKYSYNSIEVDYRLIYIPDGERIHYTAIVTIWTDDEKLGHN